MPFPEDDPRKGCPKCEDFLERLTDVKQNKYVMKIWDDHMLHMGTHFPKEARTHVGNGTYSGSFAFTLTKSPNDPYSVGDMMLAARKLMAQKSCPVTQYAWYYEEKGRDANNDPIHPHIHGIYQTETGGRIESKHFKRAWPLWDPLKPMGAGFRGGYHRPVRTDEGYSNYIKKDGMMGESKLLE